MDDEDVVDIMDGEDVVDIMDLVDEKTGNPLASGLNADLWERGLEGC